MTTAQGAISLERVHQQLLERIHSLANLAIVSWIDGADEDDITLEVRLEQEYSDELDTAFSELAAEFDLDTGLSIQITTIYKDELK